MNLQEVLNGRMIRPARRGAEISVSARPRRLTAFFQFAFCSSQGRRDAVSSQLGMRATQVWRGVLMERLMRLATQIYAA